MEKDVYQIKGGILLMRRGRRRGRYRINDDGEEEGAVSY